VLEGVLVVEELLESKGKDPYRVQEIQSYSYLEGTPGILELQAPRGRGMPYRVSRLIADQGWDIASARVGQWAGTAAAAFYLLGAHGEPLLTDEVDRGLATQAK
jgi:[protein-PII] uridylyltransferase